MPTQRTYACGRLRDISLYRCEGRTRALEQVESHGSHTASMEAREFCVRHIGLDHYDTASPITHLDQRVEKTGVIGAVIAWLDDHKPLDAKPRHEAAILCQSSIRQRVMRLFDVSISFGWSEDVHVRVPGVGRQRKGRPRDRLEATQRQ